MLAEGSQRGTFPRVGSAVLIIHGETVLLGRRAKEPNRGRWVLPGGKIEPFEPISEAAKREALEETGLQVEVLKQVGVYEIIGAPSEHRIIVYNLAKVIGGELRAGADLEDLRFLNREELESEDLTEIVRQVLVDIAWLPEGSIQRTRGVLT